MHSMPAKEPSRWLQVLERIAAVLLREELEDGMVLGDRVVDPVLDLEALVVAVEAEAGRVEVLLREDARLEHLHLRHDVEEDGVDEDVVIEQRVEALGNFEELAKIEKLFFVFIAEGLQFGSIRSCFSCASTAMS